MRKWWSFYDATTGLFTGRRVLCSERLLERNIRPGEAAIEGMFDHLSQRVDVESGEVVDYQPPQPDADHEWIAEARRWRKRPEIAEAERLDRRSRERIAELEIAQLRPLRELAVDPDNAAAKQRLVEIEAEIAELRPSLKASSTRRP